MIRTAISLAFAIIAVLLCLYPVYFWFNNSSLTLIEMIKANYVYYLFSIWFYVVAKIIWNHDSEN